MFPLCNDKRVMLFGPWLLSLFPFQLEVYLGLACCQCFLILFLKEEVYSIYTVYVIIYIYRLGLEFGLMRLQQHVPWGFDSRVVTIGVWLSWFTLLRDFSPETPVLPFHQNAIFDLNFCYLAICYLGASSENH